MTPPGERLALATMLLLLAGAAVVLAYFGVTQLVERRLGLRKNAGDAAGFLAFAAVLSFAVVLLMPWFVLSRDPVTRGIPPAVALVIGLALLAVLLRRWAASHRHPGMAARLTAVLHESTAVSALASLVLATGLLAWAARAEALGVAAFLAVSLAGLALAAGWYLAAFGWSPAWLARLTPILIIPARPRRALADALRQGGREYLALTPRAREALLASYLCLLLGSFFWLVMLLLPLQAAQRAPGAAWSAFAWPLVLGLMCGGLYLILLPIVMVAGFAFGFILLPLGVLRGARFFGAGASGGAGATGSASG